MNRYHKEFNEGFAAQRMFGKMIETQSQAWKDVAAEQLENIRTPISIEVNNLENFLRKES